MKIHEKIRQIRQGLGYNLKDVERLIAQHFKNPDDQISYTTLHRIEKGDIAKFSSIEKICLVLGISMAELFQDTDLEQRMFIRKNERFGEYIYSEKISGSIYSSPSSNMLAMEVTFKPHSKTLMEQDPEEKNIEKIIYVLMGQLTCFIGNEKIILKPKDSLTFKTSIPHHYENNTNRNCVCTITQTPKYF